MSNDLPISVNGEFILKHPPPYSVGDQAIIQCDPGYVSNVIFSTLVMKNGGLVAWEPSSITCRRKSCHAPPYLENGRHEGLSYVFPEKITYKCDEGFRLNHFLATYFCTVSGVWSPSIQKDLKCIPVKCEELPNPENGSVSYPDRYFNSVAKYTCDPGFLLLGGTEVRTCLADGLWSGSAVTCGKQSCPKLPDTLNLRYGSRELVTFECHGKYINMKCNSDGEWSIKPPYCPDKTPPLILTKSPVPPPILPKPPPILLNPSVQPPVNVLQPPTSRRMLIFLFCPLFTLLFYGFISYMIMKFGGKEK